MKRKLLTAVAILSFGVGIAQNFFTKTCYRGAFAPAPTPMWTSGWTNWDPQNAVYPAPTQTITGNITSNTTWTTGSCILLSAQCFVKNNSVLTIQPGVTILGDKAVIGACLLVTQGSTLIANGTATAPIVFTSNQSPGNRSIGDWGGVILCGLATNNCPAGTGTLTNPAGTNYIEGFPVSADVMYGGNNDNDNSGSLSYVRIEFGGYVYQPNKEINGLTMGSIGRGTNIDHIQVSFANDDAFEWFGGTVNCKYLVAYRNLDDDWDTDFGFRGNVQFCLGVRDPNIADNPAVSTSEGFESDNDPNGTVNTPLTAGIFCNVTDIGPLRGSITNTYAAGFRRGARIRRNSNLKIYNSILMDHATRGLYVDGSACETNANSGALVVKNNIFAGYGQRCMETGTFGILVNPNQWVRSTQVNDTLTSTNGILTAPYSFTAPDYRPAPGSIALSNVSFTDAALAALTNSFTSNALVAGIPASVCISNGTLITPASFVASTTLSPNYCGLNWIASSPSVIISNSTSPSPTFTISALGTFTISMILTDANGTQTVSNVVSTFTCSNVGIKENTAAFGNIVLYPNPAANMATMKFVAAKDEAVQVTLTDVTGKVVLTSAPDQKMLIGENNIEIRTESLTNGIYFVTLQSAFGKETLKLIINK